MRLQEQSSQFGKRQPLSLKSQLE